MEALLALIPFLFIFALVPGIIYFAYKQNKKLLARLSSQYEQLANKFGIEFFPATKGMLWNTNPPFVRGDLKGMAYYLYTYKTGGKNKVTYTSVSITPPNAPMQKMRVFKKNFFSGIGKALGMQDIKTGNLEFDEAFIVKGKDESWVAGVLSSEVQLLFMELMPILKAGIVYNNGSVSYTEVGNLDTDEKRENFERISLLLFKIAEQTK